MNDTGKRILMAKTGLDGHWRGPTIVATALRDAGFEVIMIGMARSDEVLQAAIDEDVDLVGLNIGGHIDVALRAVRANPEQRARACRCSAAVSCHRMRSASRGLGRRGVSAGLPASRHRRLRRAVSPASPEAGSDGNIRHRRRPP
jgi:methylmalonyl-CoA mutase C-terminal domain/subunit